MCDSSPSVESHDTAYSKCSGTTPLWQGTCHGFISELLHYTEDAIGSLMAKKELMSFVAAAKRASERNSSRVMDSGAYRWDFGTWLDEVARSHHSTAM